MSICSSPSPLSAKYCSMSVLPLLQKLEFYRIISRTVPILHSRGTFWRAVVGRPSNAHLQLWCLCAPLHHLCLMSVRPSLQKLEFYRIISRPVPNGILHNRGTFWRAVVCRPSNAHNQLWCLSPPLHHLCLLNFVPWVCVHPSEVGILPHNKQISAHITQ